MGSYSDRTMWYEMHKLREERGFPIETSLSKFVRAKT
jgi:hypothetical protein